MTAIIFLLLPQSGFTNSSPDISIDNPVYHKLDKLIASGLVKELIYGQRPWSRIEIARLVSISLESRKWIEQDPVKKFNPLWKTIDPILDELSTEFEPELVDIGYLPGKNKSVSFKLFDTVNVSETLLDSPNRLVPNVSGLGSIIDATINPLVAYNSGRHYVDGNTFALETNLSARLSPYLSLYLEPRFEWLASANGSHDVNVIVNQAYAKLAVKNIDLTVGRNQMIWGQGEHGGAVATDNPRGLDIIKLTSTHPFYNPWIFRHLGLAKYTVYGAALGPEYTLKNAYSYGWTVSFQPLYFLEIGVEHQLTLGGNGAPSPSFSDLFSEFFLARQSAFSAAFTGPNFMDHRFGGNLRITLPFLRNSVLYANGLFEDMRDSIISRLTDQMGFNSGVYIPLLTPDGKNSLRLEYEHIPAIYGTHGAWTSGLTQNQLIRGSALGPDSNGLFLEFIHDFDTKSQLEINLAYEVRDSNVYAQTLTSSGGLNDIFLATDNPAETRYRIMATYLFQPLEGMTLKPTLGYEYVDQYRFVPGQNIHNFLGGVNFEFSPSILW